MKKLPAATLMLAGLVLGLPAAHADDGQLYGLLRSRDLSPFGFLRLDMRPAHAVSIEPGHWAFETELGYQNTWALSPNVERYLTNLESSGRRALGANELQAIRDLPGENYLVDLELALLDVTFHYKLSDIWTTYLILSGVSYQGGFLDSAIEGFHDTFGFSTFGRPAVKRNQVNLIYDLKSTQYASLEAPTDGGLLDPTLGVRYAGWRLPGNWHVTAELAVKIPIAGRRSLLSTGRTDYGVQLAFQRKGLRNGFYVNAAAVYYDGASQVSPQQQQVIPTVIFGYERVLTERTNFNLQGYASKSPYTHRETDLQDLLGEKYQLSVGIRHRRDNFLITFGITENLQNVNNTPDIGFQVGLAWIPMKSQATL
ncbi:MAG TPA: DUF3187 family protein [Steroidobacter sp.]|nr:DUF3187 family protein [Steroidobacter sp.]